VLGRKAFANMLMIFTDSPRSSWSTWIDFAQALWDTGAQSIIEQVPVSVADTGRSFTGRIPRDVEQAKKV